MPQQRFPSPPLSWADSEEHLRKLSLSLRDVLKGKTNNTEEITLAANATTSTLLVDGVTANTLVTLVPKTASAAASIANVFCTCTLSLVTITHDSSTATDRTYGLVITG